MRIWDVVNCYENNIIMAIKIGFIYFMEIAIHELFLLILG